jgi:ABC-2 type transport system permease protein
MNASHVATTGSASAAPTGALARQERGRGMTVALTAATARRVLTQLRHDKRTIALVILLPCVLIGLIAWMFDGTPVLDQFGPLLVGLFPMMVMFLVTSVANLRERISGTLERLMTMPIGRGDVVVGYALAFAVLATVQALVIVGFAVWVCGMDVAGPIGLVVLVAVLDAVLGCALGLGASALARTEFQAVQLMPLVLFPQLITCGILMPRDEMPMVLEWLSRVLPLTYALDAMQQLAAGGGWADVRGDVAVIATFIVGVLLIGSTTLRRRTPRPPAPVLRCRPRTDGELVTYGRTRQLQRTSSSQTDEFGAGGLGLRHRRARRRCRRRRLNCSGADLPMCAAGLDLRRRRPARRGRPGVAVLRDSARASRLSVPPRATSRTGAAGPTVHPALAKRDRNAT